MAESRFVEIRPVCDTSHRSERRNPLCCALSGPRGGADYATVCKTVYPGSNPGVASNPSERVREPLYNPTVNGRRLRGHPGDRQFHYRFIGQLAHICLVDDV